jgi:hypothetical protein
MIRTNRPSCDTLDPPFNPPAIKRQVDRVSIQQLPNIDRQH